MSIRRERWHALHKIMRDIDIIEDDITEKFIRGAGKGGQKVNKTDSCVYLKHIPSQIEIKCQKTRSREQNRYYARKRLIERMEALVLKEKAKELQEIEKKRRQNRRRSRRSKQKMLDNKHHRGQVKKRRMRPSDDE